MGTRMLEWADVPASPVTVGDTTVTPVARSWVVRWPGGGAVWSGPAAIIVEREGRTERIPVVNLNRGVLWGLRLGAVAVGLLASRMARHRRRKDSDG